MKKVYVLIEYGGEYEDKWDICRGVFPTKELAEKASELLDQLNKCPEISEEKYSDMVRAVYDYEVDNDIEFETTLEGLITLFPEYSVEEFERASTAYDFNDYIGTYIKEINFYESENELEWN